jgi:hypothetical protein
MQQSCPASGDVRPQIDAAFQAPGPRADYNKPVHAPQQSAASVSAYCHSSYWCIPESSLDADGYASAGGVSGVHPQILLLRPGGFEGIISVPVERSI